MRFKCDENYILTGKEKLTCQRDKKWKGDIPKCLGKSVNIRMSIAKLSLRDSLLLPLYSIASSPFRPVEQ